MKIVIHASPDLLMSAARVAQNHLDRDYKDAVHTVTRDSGDTRFHVYHTKSGALIVKQIEVKE